MKSAIVTGASSGIGLRISESLCKMGYKVYGIGRDFERQEFIEAKLPINLFNKIVLDIRDTDSLCNEIKNITKQDEVCILVNNAATAYYGLHEELNPKKISEMVRTNLEVPMILTQLLLRELKKNKGYIFNISSVTALKSSPHGCAYGACKSGLTAFSKSLFDEARKYDVKVTAIHPDMTKSNLYRNADFCQADEEECYLEPMEVASVVEYILNQRDTVVISEITLQPQKHRIKRK